MLLLLLPCLLVLPDEFHVLYYHFVIFLLLHVRLAFLLSLQFEILFYFPLLARRYRLGDQLVVGQTLTGGGTLELLMTDVPDLVRVAVVAPIANSDHSSLPVDISMVQAVPNLRVRRKVFL